MTEQADTVYELAITADGFLTVHEGDEIPEGWRGEIVKTPEAEQSPSAHGRSEGSLKVPSSVKPGE